MLFSATLTGAKKKDMEKLMEKTPLPVTLGIQKMDEDVYFPCLKLGENSEESSGK